MEESHPQPAHSPDASEEKSQGGLSRRGSSVQQRTREQEEAEQKQVLEEETSSAHEGKEGIVDRLAPSNDESSNAVGGILTGSLQGVAMLTHRIMLALHLALFVVYWSGVPIGPSFHAGKQVFASRWMNVALQCFGTVQITLMLFSAQQLVMKSVPMRKTTVTGHSDVFPSWSGLSSAICDLYNQVRTSATLPVPLLAFLYLSCISGLHITTPALFGVEVFSVNELVPVNTHGWLNWTETREDRNKFLFLSPVGQHIFSYVHEIHDGSSNSSHQLGSAIGLHGGSVYAIPEDNAGVGSIPVNALHFGVQCGEAGDAFRVDYDAEKDVYIFNVTDGEIIRELTQDGFSNDSEFRWNHYTKERLYFANSSLQVFPMRAQTDRYMGITAEMRGSDVVYIVSTLDILDDSSRKGETTVDMQPPMKYDLLALREENEYSRWARYEPGSEIKSIQVLQCIFKPQQWSLNVDAQTKLVLPGTPLTPHDPSARYFKPMNVDRTYPYRPNQGTEYEYDVFSLITMFNKAPRLAWPRFGNFTFDNRILPSLKDTDYFSTFRTVDEYLMRSLDVVPDVVYGHLERSNPTQISLYKLEEALANISAAMYWAELHTSTNRRPYPMDFFPELFEEDQVRSFQTYRSEVIVPKQRARVHLNVVSLTIGLGLTMGLIVLLVLLLRHASIPSDSTRVIGILDIIYGNGLGGIF